MVKYRTWGVESVQKQDFRSWGTLFMRFLTELKVVQEIIRL
jgi:hypothetical protein